MPATSKPGWPLGWGGGVGEGVVIKLYDNTCNSYQVLLAKVSE